MSPRFPEFKPVRLEDRDFLHDILWNYRPQTSELTFTNLFIWRTHFGLKWSLYKDWLLLLCRSENNGLYALQPIGPAPRLEPVHALFGWLKETQRENVPRIERADERLVREIREEKNLSVKPTREHFDYIYLSEDLAKLPGDKYHAKRNYISHFTCSHKFQYETLTENHLKACLELTERWCGLRRCEEDLNLMGEWEAIGEALANFQDLHVRGAVILIKDKVEAFTFAELLNEDTAVVHIEKANPEIEGLYAVINQKSVENDWHNIKYINREQDLEETGLRQAKLSYHPHHFVEKYQIKLRGA